MTASCLGILSQGFSEGGWLMSFKQLDWKQMGNLNAPPYPS